MRAQGVNFKGGIGHPVASFIYPVASNCALNFINKYSVIFGIYGLKKSNISITSSECQKMQ